MWFQITHLPQRGTYFRKLTNITFAYLLSATILQYFKQIFIQGCIILAQIGPKRTIFPKRYFLKKLTITFVCLLCPILQQHFKKKFQRADHQTRLHNFGPNWDCPCPQKENLLEKLTNIALVIHIPSCYIISKKS